MDLLGTYVDIFFHTLASIIIAFLVARAYGKSLKNLKICLIFSLIGGLFIDFDHIIDSFLSFGLTFNYSKFFSGAYFHSGKSYILFHAFEYVILFWILAAISKKTEKMIFQIIALSMFMHLTIDIILFSIPIKEYFILYRIALDFSSKNIHPVSFWSIDIKQILSGL